ncbi:EscU/YscU/HrcU family type III secretion system export apparatus switch protein [Geoalkalibacter halelectricus]|uniref:EscU/YscU/HrcU family type III secretion system export apparatus switch protein n=1 Tax=Geoalkalibacter halelectricus TaxID=2847045 RepID=A0ABY5ZGX4_9BACT|nr:EscU/YscU/HrcU family type III secretion system export apparatus switch protein [Geoalkalibacter halelectricus]MDO3378018.1 EscU/YscU/HrcU family type III secretion system export apparatus switch protein [Geoalkalibacter halelectricus]UWZ78318.1 EscU/YscU/HrcU family type III secretion system export apparatus switch protein [Geoalkalibacter halelectricus]
MTKKPFKKAAALHYDGSGGRAPVVVASGRGAVAERILEKAREAGVQVVEDPDLIEILAQVPVGEEIPEELYQAVAEILAFVYRMNERYKNVKNSQDHAGY